MSARSAIPMAASRNAGNRLASTQPTYDFLAHHAANNEGRENAADEPRKGSSLSRRTSFVQPDLRNEEFRAKIKSLQYEVDALKQERELTAVRHESELHSAQTNAEKDFQRAQAAETSVSQSTRKYNAAVAELDAFRAESTHKQSELAQQLRTAQSAQTQLRETLDEAQAEASDQTRSHARQLQNIETQRSQLQKTLETVQASLAERDAALQTAHDRLEKRENEFGALEAEALELRAQRGDVDSEEVGAVRRELLEQISTNRQLEIDAREQQTELRKLREHRRAVAVVEEEKHTLEVRVRRMDDLERELSEARFQRELLEDEKRQWQAYLPDSTKDTDALSALDTPEAVAKALTVERMEKATLLDQLGALRPELVEKEGTIASLQTQLSKLQAELVKQKEAGTGRVTGASQPGDRATRAIGRLERQKDLALKEVEYLRAQLHTFEAEDATRQIETPSKDEAHEQRVQALDTLLTQYRTELDETRKQISTLEAAREAASSTTGDAATLSPRKRAATDDAEADEAVPTDRIRELTRSNRRLQDEVAALSTTAAVRESEMHALQSRVQSLQQAAQTRVLTLRSNPTDDHAALKRSTIAALRAENTDLHALLAKTSSPATAAASSGERKSARQPAATSADSSCQLVPRSSLDAVRTEVAEATALVADRDKTILRLKQVWTRQSLELLEAIASLLGWEIKVLPRGRFRLTSRLYPALQSRTRPSGSKQSVADSGAAETSDTDAYSLIFNGVKGNMTIAGGSESAFARELRPLIRFWVEERDDIPAFLAACTLEFYERSTRAAKA